MSPWGRFILEHIGLLAFLFLAGCGGAEFTIEEPDAGPSLPAPSNAEGKPEASTGTAVAPSPTATVSPTTSPAPSSSPAPSTSSTSKPEASTPPPVCPSRCSVDADCSPCASGPLKGCCASGLCSAMATCPAPSPMPEAAASCPASCARLQRCCALLPIKTGCYNIAATCDDSQCSQQLALMGTCPP